MKTVMIVDDENEILERVKSSLENDDIQVETATDSRQAIEKMSGEAENNYGLILIDTQLPGSIIKKRLDYISLQYNLKNIVHIVKLFFHILEN